MFRNLWIFEDFGEKTVSLLLRFYDKKDVYQLHTLASEVEWSEVE